MHGACKSFLIKSKIAIRFATLELVHIELNTSLYLTHERYGTWAWGGRRQGPLVMINRTPMDNPAGPWDIWGVCQALTSPLRV